MRRRTLLAVIAAGLLSLSGSFSQGSGGAAAGASGQTPGSGAPSADGLLRDAQNYAQTYGVSVAEAVRRLELQESIGALNAELTAQESNTFAGLWIEHQPAYRVVAAFTHDGDATLRRHARGQVASIATARSAGLTLVQLEAAQQAALADARRQRIHVDAGINVKENRAETYVADAAAASRLSRASTVIIRKLAREEVNIYGGLDLTTCTAGFSVQSTSGLTGVTTAAHCQNDQSITDPLGATYALTFQAEKYGSGYDWQWHTLAGATVTNTIKDGTSTTRSITGQLLWADQNVGDAVCKFGKSSGFTCGQITDKNLCFTQTDGTTGCHFIKVESVPAGNALSAPGDSGGPWFSGNTARGSHSLGFDDLGSAYTAIDYLSGGSIATAGIPGVTIMTSSPTPTATTAPAAPTGLTASATGKGAISLSWTASTGATSYNAKRSTVSGGPYTTIATGITTTTFKNSGLTLGVTYFYVVSAVNSAGEGPNSNQASATAK